MSGYSSGGKLDVTRFSIERNHSPGCSQNPLLTCPPHRFIREMVHDLTSQTKLEHLQTDPDVTVSGYKARRSVYEETTKKHKKRWIRKGNGKKEKPICEIPNIFFSREGQERYIPGKGDKTQDACLALLSGSTRLDLLAAKITRPRTIAMSKTFELPSWIGLSCDTDEFLGGCYKAQGMMIDTDIDELQNALLPLFEEKTTYRWQKSIAQTAFENEEGEHSDNIYTPSTVYFNGNEHNERDFVQKTDGTFLFYIDSNNKLGLGKCMAYLRVGNHMCPDEVRVAMGVSATISPVDNPSKMIPFLLLVCCQFRYNKFNPKGTLSQTSNLKNKWGSMSDEEKVWMKEIINYLKSFVGDLREAFIQCMDPQVYKASEVLNRMLWEAWPRLATHYNECREAGDIFDSSSISEEEAKKALNFHYAVIIAISQASEDKVTNRNYNQIMDGINTPLDFLKQLREMEIAEMIEVLYEIMRGGGGLMGSRALAVIELAVISVVLFDGDVGNMSEEDLRSITQMGFKKQAIIQNVIASMKPEKEATDGFSQVGGDTHVNRVIEIIAKLIWKKGLKKKKSGGCNDDNWGTIWKDEHLKYVLHHICHETGYFTNELLAQYGQLLKGHSDQQQGLVDIIRKTMEGKNEDYETVFVEWWKESGKAKQKRV